LAACGGEEQTGAGGGAPQGGTALVTEPKDTTASARRGGTWKARLTTDPTTFDVHIFQITAQAFVWAVGSLLFKMKPSRLEDPRLEVEGDVAESFELTPDHTRLTVKLHPGAKWSPSTPFLAPHVPTSVFNRPIDSEDVLVSWERFLQFGLGRGEMANSVNPNAPITRVTAPDSSTVVFDLAFPDSSLLPTLTISNVGYFYLVPKEGKGDAIPFDRVMIGAGPFMIEEYSPSTRMVFRRNPNFELRDAELKRPFVDMVEAPIIPDPATNLAQFRAGNIYTANGLPGVTPADVLPLKGELPQLDLYNAGIISDPQKMIFGVSKDSPFKDKRLRQAMFYAWDRDLYMEAIYNIEAFEAAGIPMEVRYNTALPCNLQGYPNGTYAPYWLDPKSSDFGPNAKYYTHDPAEAKKLIQAATGRDTLEFEHWWSVTNSFGPSTGTAVEVISAMIQDAGFRPSIKNLTTPEWLDRVQNAQANFNAVVTAIDSGGPDPASYLFQHYHAAGTRFGGFNPNDTGWRAEGDPRLNSEIEAMKREFDERKRAEIAHDLQRYIAEMGYNPRYPGGTFNFFLQWPVLQNTLVIRGDFPRQWANEWLDPTRPPLGA